MIEVSIAKRQGDFDLCVAFAGENALVTALFGPSGSGKTSVIAMVAGLSRPDRGLIRVGERVLFDSSAGIDLAPSQRRIGYVFQEGRLFPHYTVRGNLSYGMALVPAAERFVCFDEVVEVLGLERLLDRRPARLSGGEKQRVAIGRALLASPTVLLMDEPLASLDSARKDELLPFIALLPSRFRVPILYVSHAIDEVLRLADRLVLMDHGRSIASGPVEAVMAGPAFSKSSNGRDPVTVLVAHVSGHDAEGGVSVLAFAGGQIKVPLLPAPVGRHLRVRIDAGDVILSLERPSGLSVQNVFPGRVISLRESGGLVDVGLDVGCALTAQVSARAACDLGLAVGMPLFALVKSAAISRSDIAEHEPGARR